ncbi:MAG TPA: PqqD family protein [Allosphingosinicella sp.]|nr:PqqD family protein [Allosphingosinicella sp.]
MSTDLATDLANALLSAAPEIVWRDVGGDLVLFDPRSGDYHALNASASFVWRRIARGEGVAAIVAEAAASHPDQADAIARDVRAFVESALAIGLLRA